MEEIKNLTDNKKLQAYMEIIRRIDKDNERVKKERGKVETRVAKIRLLENLDILQELAANDFTYEEISKVFGISINQLSKWRREEALVQNAIDKGRLQMDQDKIVDRKYQNKAREKTWRILKDNLKLIEDRVAEGIKIESISSEIGIGRNTLYEWLDIDEEVREAYERGWDRFHDESVKELNRLSKPKRLRRVEIEGDKERVVIQEKEASLSAIKYRDERMEQKRRREERKIRQPVMDEDLSKLSDSELMELLKELGGDYNE